MCLQTTMLFMYREWERANMKKRIGACCRYLSCDAFICIRHSFECVSIVFIFWIKILFSGFHIENISILWMADAVCGGCLCGTVLHLWFHMCAMHIDRAQSKQELIIYANVFNYSDFFSIWTFVLQLFFWFFLCTTRCQPWIFKYDIFILCRAASAVPLFVQDKRNGECEPKTVSISFSVGDSSGHTGSAIELFYDNKTKLWFPFAERLTHYVLATCLFYCCV